MTDQYNAVFPEVQVISTADDKTYVDNLKIMTAQNLYDSKTGDIIKLTDKLSKQLKLNEPPIDWWASEKWDGIRALWDGEKMISRGSGVGKPKVYTYIPEWFVKTLPPSVALDGEIWIARGAFQKTSRLSTLKPGKSYSQEQIDDLWSGKDDPPVIFKVFDIPGKSEPFEERMKTLQNIVKNRKDVWNSIDYPNKKTFPIQFTEQVKIKSVEQLMNLYTKLTTEGAEGIMLRAPRSPYELKRSKYMLKYKIKEDAECIVREYILGEGRLNGLLGSIKCELLTDGKPNGIFTQIGTGFNDSQRENYKNEKSQEYIPIGSIVSFSYMEMTKDGVPRHPVYRGIRDDIKVPNSKKVPVKEVKNILKKLVNKIRLEQGPNWNHRIRPFNKTIQILQDDMQLNTVEDYLKVLREGGMILKGEEDYKAKNGTWSSSILNKIHSILTTGEVDGIITNLELVAVENLSKIPEIGPSVAARIYKEEEITTIQELRELYEVNKKIITPKQAIGLRHYEDLLLRIPREEMDQWNKILTDAFTENNKKDGDSLVITGSYRRKNKDSGDIDALISTNIKTPEIMNKFYNNLIEKGIIDPANVIAKGDTKIMAVAKIDKHYRHLDIFYHPRETFPFAILFTTGSKEFNVRMRNHALEKGYSLNEHALTKSSTGEKVSKEEYQRVIKKDFPETERDIFDFLNYEFVSPEKR